MSASFDDPNLVSAAGLVPILRLADTAGLTTLAKDRLTIPTDKGANAGAKITTLIAGMVAGADSIDDMDQLRHGGMNNLFSNIYAPSTLGSFLRSFVFGHVRQLDAIASRFLAGLATQAPALVPAVPRDGELAGTCSSTSTTRWSINVPDSVFQSVQDGVSLLFSRHVILTPS